MGKVRFKDDQPIQELRGTYGKMTFRVINGHTVVHSKPKYVRRMEERELFDKSEIIEQCVADIQEQMCDMRQAIADRQAIKKRVARLYDKCANRCRDEYELMKNIRVAYLGSKRKRPADERHGRQGRLNFGKPP